MASKKTATPTTDQVAGIQWKLAPIWNQSAMKSNRPLKPRNYIYASEVGYPFCDRFLKMKGEPYTNPPNARSLRKFFAGNVWEYIVKLVLLKAGIYHQDEVTLNLTPYKGLLDVHGRCDFIAGGLVDMERCKFILEKELLMPDFMAESFSNVFSEWDGKMLEEKIMELKAVSSYAIKIAEVRGYVSPSHMLQAFHYKKAKKLPASVVNICKDDSTMIESEVTDDLEKLYKADIKTMTEIYNSGKMPAIEPLIQFDEDLGKFSRNFRVEYSPYLTKLYGFETPDDYRNNVTYAERWNSALTRFAKSELGHTTPTGKPINLTPLNNEMKADIIKAGYDFKKILATKVYLLEAGVTEEEAE
jgi:hypothetical protein